MKTEDELNDLHFSLRENDYLYPSYFLFISDNNVLYYLLLLNNYEQRRYTGLVEVMIESDRLRKKSAGQKQTFHRVSGRLNSE